jgi:hypothetical protein
MAKPRGRGRHLFDAGMDSLLVAIELYNRPSNTGREHGVVMFLQHGFEMLLKSAIFQRTRRIQEAGDRYNYGFKKCINVAATNLGLLTSGDVFQLRALEMHRDSATHDVLSLSEPPLLHDPRSGRRCRKVSQFRVFHRPQISLAAKGTAHLRGDSARPYDSDQEQR